MTALEQNLERILKVRSADLGLFVLAMHSLIERSLGEKYGNSGNYDSENSFGKLLKLYIDDYYNSHGRPVYNGAETRNLPNEEFYVYKTLKKLFKPGRCSGFCKILSCFCTGGKMGASPCTGKT